MIRNTCIVWTLLSFASLAVSADAPKNALPAPSAAVPGAKPESAADEKVAALIAQLANDDFRIRDRASDELADLGDDAEAPMKGALRRTDLQPSARTAIEGILAKAATRKLIGPTLVSPAPPNATAAEAVETALARGSLKLTHASAEALRKQSSGPRTAGPGKPEPMWDAVLRHARNAGMTIESVSAEGEVSLLPADVAASHVVASGPFLLAIRDVETTFRRLREFPRSRPKPPIAVVVAPCRLNLLAYAEPRLLTPAWIIFPAQWDPKLGIHVT